MGRTAGPSRYGEGERCYLQALAPQTLMRDVDFSFLREQERQGPDGPSALDLFAGLAEGARPAVLGRLWVSAPGTLSPLHYDLTDSYLCQVRARAR